MRQILISVVVRDPEDDEWFGRQMPEVAREMGDTMIGLGFPVEAVAVAHSTVLVNPQRLDGQTMYNALHEEKNNAQEDPPVEL